DRPGPAVVADRQPVPVGKQRLLVGTEHAPEVRRVLAGRIEVDVVGDLERKAELDAAHARARPIVAPGRCDRVIPSLGAKREQWVQVWRGEDVAEPAQVDDLACLAPGETTLSKSAEPGHLQM